MNGEIFFNINPRSYFSNKIKIRILSQKYYLLRHNLLKILCFFLLSFYINIHINKNFFCNQLVVGRFGPVHTQNLDHKMKELCLIM